MHLSLFTDLGLRVLMRLAGEPESRFSARMLAEEFQVSAHHLTKVVTALSGAGYLKTRRGHRGGISLAVPATSVRLGEVVRRLEEPTPLVDCFRADGGTCTLVPRCKLIGRLASARDRFFEELDRSTLQDIAYSPGPDQPPIA